MILILEEVIMREKILAVIEKNSRIDIKDLAVLLGESEDVYKRQMQNISTPIWASTA